MVAAAMERFTLFVVLPWDEVCSVRNLPSGVTVQGLCCRLELLSGCPAYTYRMVSSDGRVLQDDQPLVVSVNVWDGYMVRLLPLDKWRPVYDGVVKGNLDAIFSSNNTLVDDENNDEAESGELADSSQVAQCDNHDHDASDGISLLNGATVGTVALYLSSWFGHSALCKRLLDAGVDPNVPTSFGRSPLFACAVKDRDQVLHILMKYGANSNVQDLVGETVLDVAKKNIARQCINRIRSFHANRIQSTFENSSEANNSGYQHHHHHHHHHHHRHSKVNNPKDASERQLQRQTKSARILSANHNTDLIGKNNEESNSRNKRVPGKYDNSFDFGTARSVTYDAGFSPNHRKMKHVVHVCPSQHAGASRNSPQQLVTPRSLRNFSDSDSKANTPRSPPPMTALRVAVPCSKHSAKKSSSSQHTVTWDEHVAYSDLIFSGIRENARAKTFSSSSSSSPPRELQHSNGFRYADDNSNSWHLIGQSFSPSPRSRSPDKIQNSEPVDSHETKGKENMTNNEDTVGPSKEGEEPSAQNLPDDSIRVGKVVKGKKHWSARARRRELSAIHEHSESLKTAKRRIQLSEQQKRDCKKKESFEQWLKKKRRQRLREEESSEDSSDDSADDEQRKRSNIEAFNNWMKEVEERNIKQINPNSAISLHKRKSRAIQGLIGIGGNFHEDKENATGPKDASSYMHSYNTWQKNRSERKEKKIDASKRLNARKAREDLEALRNNVLAEAVSFEEWMEHAEERKKLTKIISQSKSASAEDDSNPKGRSHSASKKQPLLSFEKWKQELEAKEAKQKILQLRKRRQQEQDKLLRDENRSSSAVAHELWVQKKVKSQQKEKQQQQQQQRHQQTPSKGNRETTKGTTEVDHDPIGNPSKQSGFESWINTKHEAEIQKIDSNIRREQQLLQELRRKKETAAA